MSSSRSASESKDKEPEEEVELNISSSDVAGKYKTAARISNEVLRKVTEKAVSGSSIVELCHFGDNEILKACAEFSKKAKFRKGIAFPTAMSVDGVLAHFSPLKANDVVLKDGDLVKLELGTHIDGFIAISAHTFVVGASKTNKVTGKKADVILAAYNAAEAAVRTLKKGNNGSQVADIVDKVCESYSTKPVENMLMYCVTQNRIEGETSILINGSVEGKKDHTQPEIKEYDVYAVDVLVTSGKGSARSSQLETTIYKLEDVHYGLKSKRSREFFTYSQRQFGLMPFNIRFFEVNEKEPLALPPLKTKDNKSISVPAFVTAKLGVKECREHGLCVPFDVQQVEEGEFVAQFKFTVFVKSSGPERITNYDFDPEIYQSEHSIKDEALIALLKEDIDIPKSKRKKAAKSVVENSGDAPAAAAE